ncbi:Coup Transcription Factor 2, partial [Manis pentadactyla]
MDTCVGVSVCDCALELRMRGRHVDCVVVLALGVSWSVHMGYLLLVDRLVLCVLIWGMLCVICAAMCAVCLLRVVNVISVVIVFSEWICVRLSLHVMCVMSVLLLCGSECDLSGMFVVVVVMLLSWVDKEVVCVFGGLSYAHEGDMLTVWLCLLWVSHGVCSMYLCKDFHVYCKQFCAFEYVFMGYLLLVDRLVLCVLIWGMLCVICAVFLVCVVLSVLYMDCCVSGVLPELLVYVCGSECALYELLSQLDTCVGCLCVTVHVCVVLSVLYMRVKCVFCVSIGEVVCVFGGLSYAHEGKHVDCVVVLALGVSWSVHMGYLLLVDRLVLCVLIWGMLCGICAVLIFVLCELGGSCGVVYFAFDELSVGGCVVCLMCVFLECECDFRVIVFEWICCVVLSVLYMCVVLSVLYMCFPGWIQVVCVFGGFELCMRGEHARLCETCYACFGCLMECAVCTFAKTFTKQGVVLFELCVCELVDPVVLLFCLSMAFCWWLCCRLVLASFVTLRVDTGVVCVFGGLSYAHEGRHVDCVVVLALGVSW